jgi:tRNA 2-thiouridine synthesizing protein E
VIAGQQVQVSDDGLFLENPGDWTRELAAAVAQEEGIDPLTEAHWAIIDFCRQEGLAEGRAPSLRAIVNGTGVPMKELFNLFPKSPDKKVARISGLRMAKRCI